MKVIIINGPMGVGKTTVGKYIADHHPGTAFIDGDWCMDIHPFVGNPETRAMAADNILHMIGNYRKCSVCNMVVLVWMMDDPQVIQRIMDGLYALKAEVRNATLVCNRENLIRRWTNDQNCEWRTDEWLNVSLKSLPAFSAMDHVIDTSDMPVDRIAELIMHRETSACVVPVSLILSINAMKSTPGDKEMRTARLFIRPMKKEDEKSFINGISDKSLRAAYGFPVDMDETIARKIFDRFLNMETAYSLIRTNTGTMIGFLLDVPPELPESIASGLPDNGRTLAYSVYPVFQRQGYMEEALRAYIPSMESDYIHCGHFPGNMPGKNLLQKLGFHEWTQHQAGSKIIVDEILRPVILT